MSWDYQKFPRNPDAEEIFKMRGTNNIISCYHYRLYPKLGRGVCAIHRIPCACTDCVDQLAKYWLPNCDPSSQQRYAYVETITIQK